MVSNSLLSCTACNEPFDPDNVCAIRVGLSYLHDSCAKCLVCQLPLSTLTKCYEKEQQWYCEKDYMSLFCPNKCRGCAEVIYPSDSVYRLMNDTVLYHELCFNCETCATQLSTGKLIYVTKTQPTFICCSNSCLQAKMTLAGEKKAEQSDSTDSVELKPTATNNRSGGKSRQKSPNLADCQSDPNKQGGKRGPRTSIQQHQLNMLNQTFLANPKPSKHARAKLALQTQLSTRVIQVWFQNRRSKERRLKHLCNWLRQNESATYSNIQEKILLLDDMQDLV